MLSRDDILEEIRRTARENGGIPFGRSRFEKETGIKPYDWEKYWVRFGDAQKEAGLEPNKLIAAYSDDYLINQMIHLIRKLGRFPVYGELRLERRSNPNFPNSKALFESKLQKQKLAQKILEICKGKKEYEDIIKLCQPVIEESNHTILNREISTFEVGEVYLFKSGRYYKIGMSNDTVRRGAEIRVQLAEKLDLIHSIKTDDPSGIEAYWHRRFKTKRMKGEWFDLNSSEVKAFKRWRKIV